MAELKIRDLHVYLGDSYVVQGATLTVGEGQAVAVLGRNGVGKTTLLRAIMGLTDPVRQGSLHWEDVELTQQPAWLRNTAGIAYVPQGRRIFPSLSVEENLLVARRAASAGLEPWTIDNLYALFPNLRERRDQRGTALSGGEQQMLALARALIANPRLILLDEPTEGLAPIVVQRVLDVLREIHRKGLALLLVEQNFRFATSLTNDVVVMQAGRFVYRGEQMSSAEISNVAERYLGVGSDTRPSIADAAQPDPRVR
jgi:branched-chain amino acid transport system ATP-binding protein